MKETTHESTLKQRFGVCSYTAWVQEPWLRSREGNEERTDTRTEKSWIRYSGLSKGKAAQAWLHRVTQGGRVMACSRTGRWGELILVVAAFIQEQYIWEENVPMDNSVPIVNAWSLTGRRLRHPSKSWGGSATPMGLRLSSLTYCTVPTIHSHQGFQLSWVYSTLQGYVWHSQSVYKLLTSSSFTGENCIILIFKKKCIALRYFRLSTKIGPRMTTKSFCVFVTLIQH